MAGRTSAAIAATMRRKRLLLQICDDFAAIQHIGSQCLKNCFLAKVGAQTKMLQSERDKGAASCA